MTRRKRIRTQVTQFLEQQQVSYRLLPHESEAITIDEAARQRGVRPAQMVKSILLRDMSDRYALACAPGHCRVDPKKVRAQLNWRRMTCVPIDEVPTITGYPIGAVVPLLLAQEMPILFDAHILNEPIVTISSGSPLAGIALQCDDLLKLCQPLVSDIIHT